MTPRAALPLTPREQQVLDLIVAGSETKEIGRALHLSPRTIEVHRLHIREKLGARNTADMVRIALSRIAAVTATACLLLIALPALARDDGRYANSPLKDWVKGLKDKNGHGCCDTADGFPAEVEYDTEREHYRVRINGSWHVVPHDALLEQPNRLGYAMVWYWLKDGVPQIRCFIPGAGG